MNKYVHINTFIDFEHIYVYSILHIFILGVEGFAVQTEGVNFEAIWALPEDLVQQNQIKCNDIWKVLHTYGVEAARSSIVMEVQV